MNPTLSHPDLSKRAFHPRPILFAILLLFAAQPVTYADSAIWNQAPTDNNWATAENWAPATVPNGPDDTATFDASSITDITIFNSTELAGLIFNPGASSYTITAISGTLNSGIIRTFSGAGIINNSGLTQTIINDANSSASLGATYFTNSAGAGNINIINKGDVVDSVPGFTNFLNSSTAANCTITNTAGLLYGGVTYFLGVSTAADAVITNEGPTVDGQYGGWTRFGNRATAGNSKIIVSGGVQKNKGGAFIQFIENSSAGSASLIAAGRVGRASPIIYFMDNSDGGSARVEVSGAGILDLRSHSPHPMTIGSLEGDGLVHLGQGNLYVGSNHLSTAFDGIISDSGSLTKVGRGILTLSNANTYTGGTTVNRGTLLVTNTAGSATGDGSVNVDGGTLAGTGVLKGAVVLGTGSQVATLSPGRISLGTLTTESPLVFGPRSVYDFALNSSRIESDQVIASGVTINGGATLSFADAGSDTLSAGTVFTVINNVGAPPIAGNFSNLADGSTIIIGNNTFQANYEGGDGNDLTLTVVP